MQRLGFLSALVLSSPVYASGSSTVHADSQFFRVQIESVRKIFEGGEGERQWHDDWKKEMQPLVNRLKKKVEADIEPLVQAFSLLPYRAELPVIVDGREDTDQWIETLKTKKPFQICFPYDRTSVCVALAKLPAKAQRRDLRVAFQKHMPRVE